jgi:nitroreductase
MDSEVLKCMRERRSIRAYEPRQISDEALEAVLQAGTFAPTGMGRQSPKMVVVQDKETVAQLSKLNAGILGGMGDPFYGAPTVVVVFADTTRPTWLEDGTLVMANLMLAAHDVGLGSCWIHRARPVFESEAGKALMAKWGIPQNYAGVAHCILGYAAETPAAKPRKEDYIVRV